MSTTEQAAAETAPLQCPDCGATVHVPSDAEVGEVILCSNCAAELEVISLDPLILDLFEEEEK
jgi:alpha-aminoadipate carrier protein LysW